MKERKAAALEYSGRSGAPVITALARGKLVDRLVLKLPKNTIYRCIGTPTWSKC